MGACLSYLTACPAWWRRRAYKDIDDDEEEDDNYYPTLRLHHHQGSNTPGSSSSSSRRGGSLFASTFGGGSDSGSVASRARSVPTSPDVTNRNNLGRGKSPYQHQGSNSSNSSRRSGSVGNGKEAGAGGGLNSSSLPAVGAANNISSSNNPHQNRSKSTGSATNNNTNTTALGKGGIGGKQSQQPPAPVASFHTKYDLRDVIGVGSTSTVHRCLERATQKEYACKIIDKRMIETRFRGLLDQFQIEIGVLKALHHPNIIHLEDVYETDTRIYMVMELMRGGELFDYVVEKGTLSEEEASNIVRCLASAIAYMHSLDIIHRDLKPENLLLATNRAVNVDAEVKIIDFGLSKILSGSLAKSFLGTRGYLAPEMLQRQTYSKTIDVWALGVIVFVLLCGCLPFDDDSSKMSSESVQAKFQLRFPSWASNLSTGAKDLLVHLLDINPRTRFTAEQALSHPWVNGSNVKVNNYLQSPKGIRRVLSSSRSNSSMNLAALVAGGGGGAVSATPEDQDTHTHAHGHGHTPTSSSSLASSISTGNLRAALYPPPSFSFSSYNGTTTSQPIPSSSSTSNHTHTHTHTHNPPHQQYQNQQQQHQHHQHHLYQAASPQPGPFPHPHAHTHTHAYSQSHSQQQQHHQQQQQQHLYMSSPPAFSSPPFFSSSSSSSSHAMPAGGGGGKAFNYDSDTHTHTHTQPRQSQHQQQQQQQQQYQQPPLASPSPMRMVPAGLPASPSSFRGRGEGGERRKGSR